MEQNVRLDSVDAEILRRLQNDGRMANKELAAAVGIAPSTCLDRVARLRRAGAITGYTAQVDPAAVGRPIEALLAVQVQPHARPLVDPFITHVLGLPETRAVHHVTGPDDFIVHVACGNSQDLQRLVLDEFTARPEVARLQTHLIFSTWPGGPLTPYPGRTSTKDVP
ncbi:Lrp/AsnC family transcriptional regulator [Amycolatopsis magusensis]|uniref:DNA-binding Lrp family transcriptional regulator n=1 Tax=Amycolatopsis magusensis TaxID=882444 RepID=A0ABS4PSP7_9PSEU|nr:Lrp/AsnC family transcriptional regulator [Amycolatopsis magusensis]MBP2181884.1 DNA-binding Lrp family transcriptional regulator [Amycolatopsis magusensis]UJW31907.1 Lrp/AsnC family transcriptional regulator [Saccharothrix sp. AJ9571]